MKEMKVNDPFSQCVVKKFTPLSAWIFPMCRIHSPHEECGWGRNSGLLGSGWSSHSPSLDLLHLLQKHLQVFHCLGIYEMGDDYSVSTTII